MTQDNTELSALRRQIDSIDDRIIDLLIERTSVVAKVGSFKEKTAPGICPIRPAREAAMLRRIMQKFEGTAFLPAAAAAIWRVIIGMSTAVESALAISVFTPPNDKDLFWLAREYFGPAAQVICQIQARRVIGDILDGKAAVGIVPLLKNSDENHWWDSLMGPDMPKVFARLPFMDGLRDATQGLAIARIEPEDSGNDNSLLVLEADHNVSQSRLQAAFATAKLEATWIAIVSPSTDRRQHLLEVRGFVTQDDNAVRSLRDTLGASLLNIHFLGSYAVPANS
jgi:chorismate mutase/prephenate dehydratase